MLGTGRKSTGQYKIFVKAPDGSRITIFRVWLPRGGRGRMFRDCVVWPWKIIIKKHGDGGIIESRAVSVHLLLLNSIV